MGDDTAPCLHRTSNHEVLATPTDKRPDKQSDNNNRIRVVQEREIVTRLCLEISLSEVSRLQSLQATAKLFTSDCRIGGGEAAHSLREPKGWAINLCSPCVCCKGRDRVQVRGTDGKRT
jgi:hypothetical protein